MTRQEALVSAARSRRSAIGACVLGLLGAFMLAPPPAANAQDTPRAFTIGVLPNVSARVIFANYQPMREYFERTLKRNVEIATATDFRSFSARTMQGEFSLVVTAANVGRVNQVDGRWDPLAIYEPPIPAVLVSAAANADAAVAQLKGKSLAVANPQSLVVLRGLQWLREQGLEDGRDYKMIRAPNDDSLGALILSGEAPLAMMSMGEFRAIGEATRKNLKVAAEFAKLPAFLLMANPAQPAEERARLKELLLAFPGAPEGAAFFARSGFSTLRAVTARELESLDPFLVPTRAALGIQ